MTDPLYVRPTLPWEPRQGETWVDGKAYRYDGSKPLTLKAFNQIRGIHSLTAAMDSSLNEVDAFLSWMNGFYFLEDIDKTEILTRERVVDFKELLETTHVWYDWQIPIDMTKMWEAKDIADLRRVAAYPSLSMKHPTELFDYLHNDLDCDYTTLATKITKEDGSGWSNGYYDGWKEYVGEYGIFDPGGTHRFWIWSPRPNWDSFIHSTVGLIDTNGIMLPPFAGTGITATWTNQPNNDHENGTPSPFWLMQATQLLTVTPPALAPLRGMFHWKAWTGNTYPITPKPCYEYKWINNPSYISIDTSFRDWFPWLPENVVTYQQDQWELVEYEIECEPESPPPPVIHPGEDEPFETGGEFFKSWEWYMDNRPWE